MIYCDKEYVAQVIQNARKKCGLKQSQLAEKIGISEKHLSKIETGKNYPALDNFLKLIEVLNLSLKDFGIESKSEISENRLLLRKIVNSATEKQVEAYIDVLTALQKHC